ncbi:hypothetical protein F5Y17DRAFT_426291 [Xylariaceae sp. FL0594]|nr:hypothetical protein F5Y17DRAFT_426291 [Xylariaceae sp. FL0594]
MSTDGSPHVLQESTGLHSEDTATSEASNQEQETCQDGVPCSAKQFFIGLACALWVLLLLFSLGILILFGALPSLSLGSGQPSACHPDGTFSPFGQDYSPWELQGFFQINLAFGHLTYTQVKAIDVVWDIVIGRGGQAVMALVSWRVFSDYMATARVALPITYLSFRVLFIETTPSISSTYKLARDLHSRHGAHSKAASIFIIWSMLLMLGWPTFAGAATGYTPTTAAFIRISDDNLVPFHLFVPLAYVISDGSRVGLGDQCHIPYSAHPITGDPILRSKTSLKSQDDSKCGIYPTYPICALQKAVADYRATYGPGFSGHSIFNNSNRVSYLEGWPLDIKAFSFAPDWHKFEGRYVNPTHGSEAPSNGSETIWEFSKETYTLTNILDQGQCQPVQDVFKWGFSFLQIFILVLSLSVWTIGTYVLWIKSRFRLPCRSPLGVPRGYTAMILLANRVQESFYEFGLSARHLGENELKYGIRKLQDGGNISPGVSCDFTNFQSWLTRERTWIIVIALGTTISLTLASAEIALLVQPLGTQPPVSIIAVLSRFGQLVTEPVGASLLIVSGTLLSWSLGLLVAVILYKRPLHRGVFASFWGGGGLVASLFIAFYIRS